MRQNRDRPTCSSLSALDGGWRSGLFIDGWAHRIPGLVDSFFTRWHAILYSAFLVNVGWILMHLWQANRSLRLGDIRLSNIGLMPVLGIVGVGIGGLLDMLWHSVYGIERGLEVHFTPPHLLLFVGACLIVTRPFCAMWASRRDEMASSLRSFLPAVLSLGIAMSVVSFFMSYGWGFFGLRLIGREQEKWWVFHFLQNTQSLSFGTELMRTQAVTNILLTNLVIMTPVLLILRRWQPPFGAITVLLTLNAVFMAALSRVEPIIVALAGGLIADLLVVRLRPGPDRPAQLRVFSAAVPAVVWTLYFLVIHFGPGVAWSWPLWTGTVVWTALEGLVLGLLMAP
jgi:hypothetical protein